MRHTDDMVKALIDTLTANGQMDNTYFMYTSDNGYHFNQHGRPHGKFLNYDTDVRVPFLIRWDRKDSGVARGAPVVGAPPQTPLGLHLRSQVMENFKRVHGSIKPPVWPRRFVDRFVLRQRCATLREQHAVPIVQVSYFSKVWNKCFTIYWITMDNFRYLRSVPNMEVPQCTKHSMSYRSKENCLY